MGGGNNPYLRDVEYSQCRAGQTGQTGQRGPTGQAGQTGQPRDIEHTGHA